MAHLDYLSFTCSPEELQAKLKEQGKQNWRLHTADPYVITGNQGVGSPYVLVVMDRLIEEELPAEVTPPGAAPREPIGGMALKG